MLISFRDLCSEIKNYWKYWNRWKRKSSGWWVLEIKTMVFSLKMALNRQIYIEIVKRIYITFKLYNKIKIAKSLKIPHIWLRTFLGREVFSKFAPSTPFGAIIEILVGYRRFRQIEMPALGIMGHGGETGH